MRNLFFSLLLSTPLLPHAQIGTGQWRMHVSPTTSVDVAAGGGIVMAAFENGVLEYDLEANENTLWTAVNGLSDINVSTIHYRDASNTFWIGYKNGNIDIINSESRVTNVPAIRLAQIQGEKEVLKLMSYGNYVYAATSFGIVKFDASKNEVRDTYYPTGQPVIDMAFNGDTIYALSGDTIYKANLNNVALADPTQWTPMTHIPAPVAGRYKGLLGLSGKLFLTYNSDVEGSDSVFLVTGTGLEMKVGQALNLEIQNIRNINGRLCVVAKGVTILYNEAYEVETVINVYAFSNNFAVNHIAYSDNSYWLMDDNLGLVAYRKYGYNDPISFSGPPKSRYYAMSGFEGRIAIAPGVIDQSNFEYVPAGAYVLEEETWKSFQPESQPAWQGKFVWDVSSISINPADPNTMALGSYALDPLSIVTGGNQVSTVYSPANSLLEVSTVGNGNTCISDVEYDEDGNLWVLNCYSNKPLKVLTADGTWYSFECGTAAKAKYTRRMVIDGNGNKWMSVSNTGVIAYRDGGTISDPADDTYKLINDGAYTGALPSTNVTALAVDFDNEIWIGTESGFAILYNSEGVFDAAAGQYNAQRIKIDFEGNVEYLLGNTFITDIEVDGGNRKWIATASSGIFLLSPDGLEILQQFTMDNSPLISNSIVDMQFNHETGELFIITDKGLVSYRADASYGDDEYDNVIVFPNPVKPEYAGLVTIQGIKANSDVKITDVAGNLVYQTTSNGGTATWNGKTLQGERAKTGVYLIWTAANEGKGRKVGKVVFIN